MFELPRYHGPDLTAPEFVQAPQVRWEAVSRDGVAPEGYHSTSMYPEYFKIGDSWHLAEESRMDCCPVLRPDGRLDVVELRNLHQGDLVALGRTENCEDGIYLHCHGFESDAGQTGDKFAFRQGRSRETSYARDYDRLIQLLRHEKEHGNIVWVLGPAFAFDYDARRAMQGLVENGYVHGILAGNALATHDLEAALLHTALGQDIYNATSQDGRSITAALKFLIPYIGKPQSEWPYQQIKEWDKKQEEACWILRRASFFDPKAGYEAIGAQFRETPANKRIHLIYSLE